MSVLPACIFSRSRPRRKRTTNPADLSNLSNERSSRIRRRIFVIIWQCPISRIGQSSETDATYSLKLESVSALVCLCTVSLVVSLLYRDRPCNSSSRLLHLYEHDSIRENERELNSKWRRVGVQMILRNLFIYFS